MFEETNETKMRSQTPRFDVEWMRRQAWRPADGRLCPRNSRLEQFRARPATEGPVEGYRRGLPPGVR